MADGIVASLSGDWSAVVRAVQSVFNGATFTLIAEDCLATESPHLEHANSLNDTIRHPRGRAFDRNREVRWREILPGQFVVTYLSDSSAKVTIPAESGFMISNEKWDIRDDTMQKLYGKWSNDANDWVEVSVPGVSGKYQELITINPPPNSLQLKTVDYIRDGIVQMTRFCRVHQYLDK